MFGHASALWTLIEGARPRYAAAIVAMVLSSCFLYLVPLVPQAVIDGVLLPSGTPSALSVAVLDALGGAGSVSGRLWVPALAVVAISAVAGGFTYLRGRWSALASEEVIRRLRDRVYDHLQRLPAGYFDEAETGDLIQRCTSDVDTVRQFLANQVVEIARALVMFVVPLPLMWSLDRRMTVVSVLLVPPITAFSTLFFLRVRSAFQESDAAEGAMTTTIQENLTGIQVVRAFARQEHEQTRFAERSATYRGLDHRLFRIMAVFWTVSDAMTFTQQGLVVGAGVWWVSQGTLDVGVLFYFLTAVTMFVYPLRQMGRIVADLGKATVSLGRLRAIMDEPVEEVPVDPVAMPGEGALVLRNVTFSYNEGGPPALCDLTLEIPARSTVALVGASGAGKSTLVALLLRLYDPQRGAVLLDGVDLRDLDRVELRRRIAVVMQQPFLYSRSLRDNLRLGRPGASDAEVERAAQTADVHSTIERFDAGYDTPVGERGLTLSGGQRQRVALARALLQRPAVFVLDDALSAVDNATESTILARLAERRGQQTTILIAHRLTTVALADRIFVLDEGRVVQEGSHETLVALPGAYADLWRLQRTGTDA